MGESIKAGIGGAYYWAEGLIERLTYEAYFERRLTSRARDRLKLQEIQKEIDRSIDIYNDYLINFPGDKRAIEHWKRRIDDRIWAFNNLSQKVN